MSLFGDLDQTNAAPVEAESLGGSYVKTTGVYDFVVEMAYGGMSGGGAYFIDMKLKTENGERMNVREYITSGSEKGTRPYYIDKDGKQRSLPGYSKMNAVDVILTGNAAQYPITEPKQIMLWNKDAEKEVPTQVEVVTGWIGKPLTGLVKCTREFKQVDSGKKKANGQAIWIDSTDTRESAEVVHFVDAVTGQTRSEKVTGKDAAVKPQFESKFNSDYVYDKTKGKGKPAAKADEPAADAVIPFGQAQA